MNYKLIGIVALAIAFFYFLFWVIEAAAISHLVRLEHEHVVTHPEHRVKGRFE